MATDAQKIQVLISISGAQLNAQKVTNSLLSDVLNAQLRTNGLLGAQNALARKRVSADKFASQENAIEKFRKQKTRSAGPKTTKPGKVDWLKVLKIAGVVTAAALVAEAIRALSGGLAGLADRFDSIAQGLEDFEVKVRETATKVKDFLTPIAGFSTFGLRQMSMGVDAAKSGKYATTGKAVRGAVGRSIRKGARGTANLAGKAVKGTANLALDGVELGLNKVAGANTAALADKLDDIAIRQGARARSTTLATGLTPKTLKDSLVSALKTTRERAASFVQGARQGTGNALNAVKNAPGNLNTQRKLFMQGITGADDVSVLRTANRPFPNVARGAGNVGMEAGGVFRAGRGIRTGVQTAVGNVRAAAGAARQAVSAATPQGVKQFLAVSKAAGPQAAILGTFDDIVKNLKNLKVKTITSLGSALKALPGQFANLGKSLKTFGGSIKSAVANFDLGKAAVQVSKVGSRGAQGVARGAAGIVRGAPGAARSIADTIAKARAPRSLLPGAPPSMMQRAGGMLKGAGGAVKGTSSIVKRIPILGSLISAGFGAMEANTEEMERLRAENPQMDDEQIKKGLADGTLKKDKAKIIGRSAGAGAGAGIGTVVGGILGSALGPIGTAVGAAAGAWLGENVGKFLGEGFANTFKSFNWGETFGPVITSFKELAGSITGALDTVAGAFGIKGDGEGGSGGFIQALKNIGRIIGVVAKVLMKILAPALQVVAKTIKGVVDLIGGTVSIISKIIKGTINLIKAIVDRIPAGLGGGFLRGIVSNMEGAFSGDVIGNISNFVDGVDTSLGNAPEQPNTEQPPEPAQPRRRRRQRGSGIGGGGFNLLNPMSWFSGDAQKATRGELDNVSNDTFAGKLYNRRKQQEEMMKKLRGGGGREPGQKGRGSRKSSFIKPGGRGFGIGGGGSKPVRVSSRRGPRNGGYHQGVDIAPTGSRLHMPMFLPRAAKITDNRAEGNGAGYGNSIYFTTDDGITHLFAHMKNKSRLKVGQTYPAGTQVGLMGYSGKTIPKGPDGTHLHWETGTNEADVGRAGSSLFDPLSRYSKFAPFNGDGSSSGPDSDYTPGSMNAEADYGKRTASSQALAVSPLTARLRSSGEGLRQMSERIANSEAHLKATGISDGLAAAISGALAPLGSLGTYFSQAAQGGGVAPDGGVATAGDVSMFPTTSPVRDGGHVFQGDV